MPTPNSIRTMQPADIPAVGDLWLATSIDAHDFVPARFWRSDLETMVTEILPDPKTEGYVHEEEGVINAFMTLGGNTIGCLFVARAHQREGVGSALLEHVKESHDELNLKVYKMNKSATDFYTSRGFRVVGTSVCQNTNCDELKMQWKRETSA